MDTLYLDPMKRPTAQDLGKLPLFGGLPEDALRAFSDSAEVQAFEAGSLVFREDEGARTLYVLESGALEVVKRKGESAEVVLSKIRPGESFGEMSFIDMQPRSASVRATTTSTVWTWPYSAFHERYCKDSKCYTLLVMNLARELSRRLRRADDLLASTSPRV
jgi:CRP/FNR family transcriptional regulator, cyclic AMP receptor protein